MSGWDGHGDEDVDEDVVMTVGSYVLFSFGLCRVCWLCVCVTGVLLVSVLVCTELWERMDYCCVLLVNMMDQWRGGCFLGIHGMGMIFVGSDKQVNKQVTIVFHDRTNDGCVCCLIFRSPAWFRICLRFTIQGTESWISLLQ